jgi:hypothetical protein
LSVLFNGWLTVKNEGAISSGLTGTLCPQLPGATEEIQQGPRWCGRASNRAHKPANLLLLWLGFRESAVGKMTDYRLVERGIRFRVPEGTRFYFFLRVVMTILGRKQSTFQWRLWALFPRVKVAGVWSRLLFNY